MRRSLYSVAAVALVEVMGTVGFHLMEGVSWVDAFFFQTMLATGQGPPFPLKTDGAKLFASIMAFVSLGVVIASFTLALGPYLVRLWHQWIKAAEAEGGKLERDLANEAKRLEDEISRRR